MCLVHTNHSHFIFFSLAVCPDRMMWQKTCNNKMSILRPHNEVWRCWIYIFESFLGEKVRRMDHYQKNDKTEKEKGLGRKKKNKRWDRKGESNDSPEIPDRREPSDIPSLPSGLYTWNFKNNMWSCCINHTPHAQHNKIK